MYFLFDTLYKDKMDTRNMKKALMVYYYYPPLSGSGVFRSLKFSKYLGEFGWQPTIIAAQEPPRGWWFRDTSLMDQIPMNIDVYRIDDEISTGKNKSVTKELEGKLLKFIRADVFKYDPETIGLMEKKISEDGGGSLVTFP